MERTGTQSHQQPASSESSLESVLQQFNAAFNRFDEEAIASFWAEDGTLINPVGSYGKGRSGILKVLHDDLRTILGGTTSTFTITSARKVGSDCVLLDLDHDLENFRHPDGSKGPMKLHAVILAQQQANGWKWLDARPYGFLPRPPAVH